MLFKLPLRALGLVLVNAALFQGGWFVAVLGGNLWAAMFTVVATGLHFYYLSDNPRADFSCASLTVIIGLIHDNVLAGLGVIDFSTTITPIWIACIWWLLGITLRHSLGFIYRRPLLSAVGGALSAPLAYSGGIYLSDALWGVSPVTGLLIISFVWLLILPAHRRLLMFLDPDYEKIAG